VSSRSPSRRRRIGPSTRSPIAKSNVRAVRGTSGIPAGRLPFPTICKMRCPRSKPRSSTFAPHASLTRSPFNPSSTASAACTGEVRSAVYRNEASSPRSMPRCAVGCTCGRRTYWAGRRCLCGCPRPAPLLAIWRVSVLSTRLAFAAHVDRSASGAWGSGEFGSERLGDGAACAEAGGDGGERGDDEHGGGHGGK
jgi:hypothetical protein